MGRPPNDPSGAATHHLGLRMTESTKVLLDAIVQDERRRVGKMATVSASAVVIALIADEAERRGLAGERQKREDAPPTPLPSTEKRRRSLKKQYLDVERTLDGKQRKRGK
jgi:hypothetical protein